MSSMKPPPRAMPEGQGNGRARLCELENATHPIKVNACNDPVLGFA